MNRITIFRDSAGQRTVTSQVVPGTALEVYAAALRLIEEAKRREKLFYRFEINGQRSAILDMVAAKAIAQGGPGPMVGRYDDWD